MTNQDHVLPWARAQGGMLGLLIGARWSERNRPASPLVRGAAAAQALVMANCLGTARGRHFDRDELIEGLNRCWTSGDASASVAPHPLMSEEPGEVETRSDSELWKEPLVNIVRALPLAIWFRGPPEYAVSEAMRQVLTPERDAPILVACAQICLWLRHLQRKLSIEDAWNAAIDDIEAIAPDFPNMQNELVEAIRWMRAPVKDVNPAMDLIAAARDCLTGDVSFAGAMTRASASSLDGDGLLGALVGGLAGFHLSVADLPLSDSALLLGNEAIKRAVSVLVDRADLAPRINRLPPRTSSTHALQVTSIPLCGGRLALTESPGKSNTVISTSWGPEWVKRDLTQDLKRLRQLGVDALITVMEPDEITESDLGNLASESQVLKLNWYHIPMSDGVAPDHYAERELAKWLPELRAVLARGGTVAIHGDSWFDKRLDVAALWIAQAIDPNAFAEMLETTIAAACESGRQLDTDSDD